MIGREEKSFDLRSAARDSRAVISRGGGEGRESADEGIMLYFSSCIPVHSEDLLMFS